LAMLLLLHTDILPVSAEAKRWHLEFSGVGCLNF
jgi:hypothetical protein